MKWFGKYTLQNVLERESESRFSVISTFAGCGGSSTGYRLAGGRVAAVNEFVSAAAEAYATNYPSTPIVAADIRSISGADLLRAAGVDRIDIVDGSPPCSSFSTAGLRDAGWGREKKYSDTKQRTDDLFFEFARIVKDIQPLAFIAENVAGLGAGAAKGLLGSPEQLLWGDSDETFLGALRHAGYRIAHGILDASMFGVGQRRHRMIIVGARRDIGIVPTLPRPEHEFVSLRDVLYDVKNTAQDIADADCSRYAIAGRLAIMPDATDRAICGDEYGKGYFSLCLPAWGLPCPTITATAGVLGAASVVHPSRRKFTVPELIRIQGLPEDYYLGETYANRVERIGRSVPPPLMKAVAEHVFETVIKPARAKGLS